MDTLTHTHHAGHTHAATGGSWSEAARATLHCLTGCAIGEVLGLVIGTALGLSTGATIALAVALAFVFGYALTLTPVLRSGVALKAALAVTLAADTVSITVMEVVDNSRHARRSPAPWTPVSAPCCSGVPWRSRWRSPSC